MRGVLKAKWLILFAWLLTAVILVQTAPDMSQLVREKGQVKVPDGYSSSMAAKILDDVQKQKEGASTVQAALVFYSDDGLDAREMDEIRQAVDELKQKQERLGIADITSHFTEDKLKDKLVSKDGKTVLVALSVEMDGRTRGEVRDALYGALTDIRVEHYYTGGWLIDEDVITSSQEGLKKTEWITVVFILLILFVVFRSFVAPLIPLLVVGLTYVTAQAIVAFLVEWVDFPLSTFTQIFMVSVMFGIGTDYCILLISRFKEELARLGDVPSAIVETYRTAGRTVFFSGLAVLAGFASIGLSEFLLYKSAVAVAVGVAVMLLGLVTLVPFFMAVLGKKLFWPAKGTLEHRQSRLWDWAGRFSLKRPLIALLLVAAVVTPALIAYNGSLSFNSLEEIGEEYRSVKGFNLIAEHFGPGESLPAKVVLKHDQRLDNVKSLALIEKISRELEKVEGVAAVRSATRPTGEEIEDLLVTKQAEKLDDGLGKGTDGVQKIRDGLSEASVKLSEASPEIHKAASGVNQLITGTIKLKSGVGELQANLSRIEQGLRDGSMGAADLKKGMEQAGESAAKLHGASLELLEGYRNMETGLGTLSTNYVQMEQKLSSMTQALGGVEQNLAVLAERYPELKQDREFLMAKGTLQETIKGTVQLADGMKALNQELSKLGQGLQQANAGMAQAVQGQQALTDGLGKLVIGIGELQAGLEQAAKGQRLIISHLPEVTNGLEQINGGHREMEKGFRELGSQLTQLTDGLEQSVQGLTQVSAGLKTAQSYLDELAAASDAEMAGWFMPDEALKSDEFQKVLDTYMSKDRKVVMFDVVFADNPYKRDTLDKVDDLEAAVQRAISGTPLEGSVFGISGVSAAYADLDDISHSDYSRTVTLMLIGIAVILAILLRSLLMPLYLGASLVLTYYTSMGVTEFIFVDLLGHSGISWAVPFFAFVILVALGIDYSIFLMDRFNEYKDRPVEQAILEAMRNMGTVIISAVVILGGTFAAMYPSGVLSLLQIATIVLVGLILYALVFLPFFVPVMVKTFGKANWWPFARPEDRTIEL